VMLAKAASLLTEPAYEDAKSQFAVVLGKFNVLSPETEKILLAYYNTGEEYIRRMSLISLARLKYPGIEHLIKQSWEESDDEHHRMGCLFAIVEYIKDDSLLKHYLQLAASDTREYIKAYADKLRHDMGK
jgi:hypothetical protein